jgi:hypothetical protein
VSQDISRFDVETELDLEKIVADPEFKPPDLIGTVEGWRAWQVSREVPRFGNPPKLYSATHGDYYWAPRKAMQAFCPRADSHGGVPGQNCRCGFYSAKTLPHLMTMPYHRYDIDTGMVRVVGRVANWGGVVPGSHGWRAEWAYPVELYVPFEAHRIADALEEAYGVPVKLQNVLNWKVEDDTDDEEEG